MSAGADPQIVASDPAVSAFVEANAGSGKTYTLVTRVARLLLRGVRPEAILCVTYTKAAAAEMQTRLFQTLGRWAIAGDPELDRELARIAEPGRDRSRARALFARALETPGGLKIQTLHGFCEQLLRRFPLEAGLAPGFRVMEEAESARLSRLCREELAEAVLAKPRSPLAEAYAHFAVRLAPKDFDGMFDLFASRRRVIGAYNESLERSLSDDVWGRCGFSTPTSPKELEATFIADTRWSEWKRRAGEIALSKTKTAQDLARDLRQLGPHSTIAEIRRVLLTGDGEPRKFRGANFSTTAQDWVSSEQARMIRLDGQLKGACIAQDTVHALTLAIGYIELFEGAKNERNALDFDDLVERVKDLLTEKADAAWVLYKLDGGIDHVLLDEAQDTAPAQWDVLRALTEEFFVGKGAGADRRTLFAVGDEKQSIYSFQGAAPERLAIETQGFRDAVTTAGFLFEEPKLLESRRSTPEILAFVDAVFADPEVVSGLRTARGSNIRPFPLKHLALRVEDGCVDLWPREVGGDPEEVDPWGAPVDAEPGESANKRLAGRIALAIREMVDLGEAVIDKESGEPRPMRYADVLILVRRRNILFDEIIRALKREGVPIAGRDRLKLAEHGAFDDLRALGRFACFPGDDLALAGLLRSPFCDVSEESLFALAHGRKGPLWAELNRRSIEHPAWRAATEFLGWVRDEAARAAPFDLYGRVLGRLDAAGRSMRQRLLTRLGGEAEEAIDAFLGCALDAEARGIGDLETFVAGLDASELEIKREAESAAETGLGEVRVMTAHGAKGLEAPVVILPDTSTKAKAQLGSLLACPDGGLFWCGAASADCETSKEARARLEEACDHESLRLLYVALTRARDRLIVCGVKGKRESGFEGSWYEVIERAQSRLDMRAIPLPGGGEGWRYGEDPYVLGRAADAQAEQTMLPAWARNLAPAEGPLARYASPSTVLEDAAGPVSSPLATVRGLGRFRRGEIIHRLLQLLPDVAPERRQDAARRLLAREPGLDQEQREEMTTAALSLLEDERFAAVFGPGSRAEVAVAGSPLGLPEGLAVSGRLDRLVVEPGRVLVVDFKTNRPAPERIEDASDAYILQMALYRAVLAEAFPGRRIEAALVWTDGPRLMGLPPALMDAALQRLASDRRAPTSTILADGVF